MSPRGLQATRLFTHIGLLAALLGFGAAGPVSGASTPPPAAPTNLAATAASSSSIAIQWSDNSSNETGFLIKRATSLSGKWASVTTTSAGITSFVNTGLITNKAYYYKVCAVAGRAKSAFSNIATAAASSGVNQPPTANAGADRSSMTLTAIAFSGAASSDPDGTVVSYAWSFGDGATAAGVSASHSYATAGSYTVTLTVADNGGMTASDTASVTVSNRAPLANAGSDETSMTLNALSFSGSASSDPDGTVVSYAWSFGDGATAAGVSASHSYATAGSFTVTLTVTDNGGMTASDTASVTVSNRAPLANAGADRSAMVGVSVPFSGSASSDADGNISSYSWNFGDGGTGSGLTASHVFASAGTYTVGLTVTDNLGSTGTDTAVVTVAAAANQPPVANAGSDRTSLTLTALSFSGSASSDPDGTVVSYAWSFGDGSSAAGVSASHSYTTAGSYTVTLTVTDNGGLTASDTASVTVSNRAPLANAGPDQSATAGVSVPFSGSGSSDADGTISSYSWNFGDGGTGSGLTAAHTFASAGTYTVSLSVIDNLGSTGTDTAIVTVTVAANLLPIANAGSNQTSMTLTPVSFNSAGSSDPDGSIVSFSWSFGDGTTAAGSTASHSFALPGTYTVTLTVTDNLGGSSADTAVVTAMNRAPQANAGPDQPATVGTSLSFSASGSSDADGSIASYSWNFGDGGTGVGQTASHTFSSIGNYVVTLTVTDNLGATDTDTAQITVAAAAAPAVPTNLSGTASSPSQINLTWTGSGASFKIEHASSSTGPWSLIGTTAAASFQDTSLSGCSTWFYHVSACNASGACSAFSGPASTTTLMSVPNAPGGVSATATSSSQIHLTWTNSSSCAASSYKIDRSMAPTGPWSQIGTATAMNYLDSNLSASTGYYYHVRATNASGDSAYSNTTNTTTLVASVSPGEVDWARRFGGSSVDFGRAISVDGSGNVVVAGGFMGTTDLGSGSLTSAGGTDLFIAKYTALGAPLWSVSYGTASEESVYGMALDGNGNIIVLGTFSGDTNLGGSTLTSAGSTDIFIAKYSPTGSHIWSKRLGAASIDTGCGIATDTNGNVFVSGTFAGTIDFGAVVVTGSSGGDGFLAKYASDGTNLWARKFVNSAADVPSKLATDASGDLFVAGYFSGSINLGTLSGTLLVSAGAEDVFVAKVSGSNGAHIWSKRFGADRSDMGRDLKVDGNGNVLVTGSFYNTIDFGGGALPSAGFLEAFVAELSGADGAHVWSRSMGGPSDDKGDALGVDSNDNVIVTGTFSQTANFGGTSMVSTGGSDMFVAKYSTSGSHVWSCGEGGDVAPYLAVNASGNAYMTGYFNGSINFGTGTLASAGSADVFLVSVMP